MTITSPVNTQGYSERLVRPSPGHFRLLAVVLIAASPLVLSAVLANGAQAGVAKGICSPQLESEPAESAARAGLVREISRGLDAEWTRIGVNWAALEPTRGEYSPTELARLDALVRDLRAAGTKVMLTTCYVPAWATQSYWWTHPPAGFSKGPQPFYPIRDGALKDYARLGEFLARHFRGDVQALECGNEPNLWMFLYPQRTASDPYFAARVYLRMLKAFHAGVSRAHSSMPVVAGATAPVGLDDIYRTSPQRFARFLRKARAGRYFDAYSHHPYTPGGSIYTAPSQPPNDPSHTVTLYNLRTLLRLFPKKPFYLTEYGYSTQASLMFGLVVSEQVQARYLKTAYRYAARYPQVKLLTWYLVRDQKPGAGPADLGVYCGLRRPDGSRKPSWYAFRGL